MAKNKCTTVKMTFLDKVTAWSLVVGGINWLPAGISLLFGGSGQDFVRWLLGSNVLSGIIFTAVGLSGVYFALRAFTGFK